MDFVEAKRSNVKVNSIQGKAGFLWKLQTYLDVQENKKRISISITKSRHKS